MAGTLQDTDILNAVNSAVISGNPLTAAQLATAIQYLVYLMQRDEQTAKAAAQTTANTAAANAGATALAGYQNGATTAQTNINTLLGGQSF